MILKPITSEKAVRMIDAENIILFEAEMRSDKNEIKKEIEKTFGVKVDKVRTLIKSNKKYAYVKLNKSNLAVDLATRLGMI